MGNQVFGQQYKNILTAATTIVKAAPGTLVRITINLSVAGKVSIFDNASAASGTTIGAPLLVAAATPYTITYECDFVNGLTILTAAGPLDLTVVYF